MEKPFDLSHTLAKNAFEKYEYPWEVLKELGGYILFLQPSLDGSFIEIKKGVFVHSSCKISPSAEIVPPCIIGARTEIRQGAFIRGKAVIGEDCVIGNSTEIKNSVLFDGVQVPHFNYVGDSVLGFKSHLGAGVIISNLRCDGLPVKADYFGKKIDTGLRKLGALVGDFTQIGCNSVLNPGTVIGKNSFIYPLTSVRGFVPPNSVVKR